MTPDPRAASALLCLARSRDIIIRIPIYSARDPYNHRHVFDISSAGKGARARARVRPTP